MSNTRFNKKLMNYTAMPLISAATFAVLGITAPLHAQETSDTDDIIYVTGEKRTKSLQDTQTSAAVLTGDELDEKLVLDLEEALLRVGNADISTTGSLSIRGIGKNGPTGGITTNRLLLGYYVDGVALSSQAQRFAQSNWDVDQVEVLRGPVTTVQGRNALSGGLLVTTAAPEFELGGKLRASYGQHDTYQIAGAITGPLIEDQAAIRLSVDHNDSDGFTTNTTTGANDFGNFGSTTIRGKILVTPTALPDFSATLAVSHILMDRAHGLVKVVGPDFEERNAISSSPAESKTDGVNLISLTLNYDLSDNVSLKSVTAFQNSDVRNSFAFLETDIANPQRVSFGEFEDEMLTQELLLTFDYDNVNVLAGFFYANIKNEQARGSTFDAGLVNPLLAGQDAVAVSYINEEIQNYAGFLDVNVTPLDWLEISAGVRIDSEKNILGRDSDGLVVPALMLEVFPGTDETIVTEGTNTEVLPRAGIVASLTEDLSLGFSYAHGYRPGGSGVNLTEVLRTGVPDFFDFGAEKTKNYELSLRSQWFDRALTANINAYYIDWTDQQVSVEGSFGSQFDDIIIANAGMSTVKGIELETFASIGNLDLFASAALSETEFGDFAVNGFDFNGLEFPRSPNFSGGAGAAYSFDNGLYFSATVNHIGEVFQNSSNTRLLPDFTTVNATASYEVGPARLFVFAKNIFDVEGTSLITFEGPIEFRRLRAPRYVGGGIELSF